ncbi:hypothetical protein [Kineosporia babensis]|uniref:SWIM-type domain-containing protein n=1 Tax=Kineosporia babensis TaxID=499548 RepID=A0A9X1NBC3_9ACTN|nr:hypothetical protein [Kineosporia babensis]MCD5312092.1 hypothetical protein [Kineosporia babensis]
MRAELLALTPDSLAELTNRGLVKRATRDVERAAPVVVENEAGTLAATFADGVTTELPVGGLEAGRCSCGAVGICRHVLALVLVYTASAQEPDQDVSGQAGAEHEGAAEAIPENDWSPATFTDEELEAHIGKRALTAARRAHKAGYAAHVRRAAATNPVPSVDLPSATVRFHVPGDLGYARSDAKAGTREDLIALAVWAFRAADEQEPTKPEVHVQVGGEAAGDGGNELEEAVTLATTVLTEGAVNLETGLATQIATARKSLEAARLRWPLLALDDLDTQLQAYRDRSARYRPEALADHVAELLARHRAVTNDGTGLHSRILGTDEASQTQLRQARLDGLGARVRAFGDERTVEVFLAHADSASVLVLRKVYKAGERGDGLAARRVAGTTIQRLAGSSVITDSAQRSASRTVRIGSGSLSRTHAMTAARPWQHLPPGIMAPDLQGLARELDELPPRLVRARVEAELVRVIPLAGVEAVTYSPGDQRLDAVVTDAVGTAALISATHESCTPGRLDALAAALEDDPRYVSGMVARRGGRILIDPIALAFEDRVIVPDLAPTGRTAAADGPALGAPDVLHQALDETAALLAEIAHRGMGHLPPTMTDRLQTAAGMLRTAGLVAVAADVQQLVSTPPHQAVDVWANAYLRVSLARDLS